LTSRKFVFRSVAATLLLVAGVLSVNIYINEFGLFGDVRGEEYRVHAYEKTTKYLFSYNYIPSNFEGILVGPSFGDQMMDTRKIEHHRIYNLSMDGSNISELKFAIDNVLKYGDIKYFLICLDPYITRDSGRKSSQIDPREYYATLGSLFLPQYYRKKHLEIKKGSESPYHDSSWGYTDNTFEKKDFNTSLMINYRVADIEKNKNFTITIDPVAYLELSEIVNELRKKKIQILAYYYPHPKRFFEKKNYKREYKGYQEKIGKLLDQQKDIIIDFNQEKYDYIRGIDTSYSDGGHLSAEGAKKLLAVLSKELNALSK